MSDPLAKMPPVKKGTTLSLKDITPPCATLPRAEADKIFFSESSEKRIAKAKAICATCPMTQECLELALSSNCEFGIFGGLTPSERAAL